MNMEWVSIKDRMPPEDSKYLVHALSMDEDKPYINIAWYEPNGFGWSLIPETFIESITHWMEVPKAPQGQKEE